MKLLMAVLLFPCVLFSAQDRPNILWLVAEDINPDLGCYGDTYAKTPNLDRFAGKSLRYTGCWSVAPVCAPARTALITGVYPPSLGAEHMRSSLPIPEQMKLYPQVLRSAGYYCVNNAKEDYNVSGKGKVWDESSKSAHWRNRAPGQPFLAVFNFETTHESRIRSRPHQLKHDPLHAPVPAYHPDTPEVRHDWAQYYDNLTTMDSQVEARLEELRQAGLEEDTIVFFYGDNGSGMPRHKRWPFDSGLKVPLIVHIPAKWNRLAPPEYAPGSKTDRLVSFVDFAPTLYSLAGTDIPDWVQGRAFLGPKASEPRKYNFGLRGRMDERTDLVRSVSNGRYVYVRNYMPHLVYGQYISYMFQTPTTRVWKQLFDEGKLTEVQARFWNLKPAEELYDLSKDPDEVQNLAGSSEHSKTLQELRAALKAHLLETGDRGLIPEAELHRGVLDYSRAAMETRLAAAENASRQAESTIPTLRSNMKSKDPVVRYWGAMGALIQGPEATRQARTELQSLLQDNCPSVAITAARALATHDEADLEAAVKVLKRYASPQENGCYVSLEALSAMDALQSKIKDLDQFLLNLPRVESSGNPRARGYTERMIKNLLDEDSGG